LDENEVVRASTAIYIPRRSISAKRLHVLRSYTICSAENTAESSQTFPKRTVRFACAEQLWLKI